MSKRPPPPADRKTKRSRGACCTKPLVCFRAATEQRERWERAAAAKGLRLSEWIRMVATEAATNGLPSAKET